MTTINFKKIHPRTELWWTQRSTCDQCAHCDRRVSKHKETAYPYRCTIGKADKRKKVYCIDMRDEGQPCGPDAKLFQPKEQSK